MSETNKILGETQRWLAYAQRDLDAAFTLGEQEGDFAPQICFLAQQAAEKSLKAALIFLQVEFPFRHDLDLLKALLPEDWESRQLYPSLKELTIWAVASRYPSLMEDASRDDADIALKMAIAVFESVKRDLQQRNFSL
ncbi:MAG: HEPN domain-containing protein [Snowella sp.]|nr:HEPN domain-containing protein [Snowella sp.]